MITLWFMYFMLLGSMWLFWEPLTAVILRIIVSTGASGSVPTNIIAIMYWFPVFVALGGLIYIMVQSQRQGYTGVIR